MNQIKNTRPYWKVAVSLLFSLLATILFVIIGWKLIIFFLPFVIGWIIASIANPLVCWLEKHLKIVKKLGSALTIIAVLAGVIGLVYLAVSKIVQEVMKLISDLPKLVEEIEKGFDNIAQSLAGVLKLLPQGVKDSWSSIASNFESAIGEWLGTLSEPTVEVAGNVAKSIPSIMIGVIITILSAYFFIADRENIILWAKRITPRPIQERMSMVTSYFKNAIGGYFKAQFQIMLVLSSILLIGFLILNVNYAIILAIVIAFLDFLPFFGTAITLVPWAVYKLFGGDLKTAIGLIILYGLTQLVRQVIQPKLVSNEIGLKPIPTLILLYIGYKLGSVWGMIIAIPMGMILINMYKAGAFDYILNDVKILIQGIMKLRE